ncbi:MAG: hypothetical protein NZ811_05415 [Gammaproteobacteria bacterium]|nr:hypothetical protein [Gammaproteobacteria bacterium]
MNDTHMEVLYKSYAEVLNLQHWINFEHDGRLYELRLMEPVDEDPMCPIWWGQISRLTENLRSSVNIRTDRTYEGGHEVQIYRETHSGVYSGFAKEAIRLIIENPTGDMEKDRKWKQLKQSWGDVPLTVHTYNGDGEGDDD